MRLWAPLSLPLSVWSSGHDRTPSQERCNGHLETLRKKLVKLLNAFELLGSWCHWFLDQHIDSVDVCESYIKHLASVASKAKLSQFKDSAHIKL